jgi:hypothetical protein
VGQILISKYGHLVSNSVRFSFSLPIAFHPWCGIGRPECRTNSVPARRLRMLNCRLPSDRRSVNFMSKHVDQSQAGLRRIAGDAEVWYSASIARHK